MRQITLKYANDCRKCGNFLSIGEQAIYEKRVGIFCLNCAPSDSEEIREYRQEASNRRADKYEEWAAKRERKANAQLNNYPNMRRDYAFITQPGHIPFRAKMIAADDRAYQSLRIAQDFKAKAKSLRNVRVKGDAERNREQQKQEVLSWLKIGDKVDTVIYGQGIVKKINKKTAKISDTGASGTFTINVPIHFLRRIKKC